MLQHDPIPWLLAQDGLSAVRARRSLGIGREGDEKQACRLAQCLADSQLPDGSLDHSPMRTAGALCLLADLDCGSAGRILPGAAEFLFAVLAAQPGYESARELRPGSLRTPCDLGGFFGPYARRDEPDMLAQGAREMNAFREFEPLLGPKRPVRAERRSPLDRVGPSSCYAWGLIPLCYIVEALCRAGHHADRRLDPATSALLGAQRRSGGWCRNAGGDFNCTVPALRALGAHPALRGGPAAEAALRFLHAQQTNPRRQGRWRGSNLYAALAAVARFDASAALPVLAAGLAEASARQERDGTFGEPCRVERVAAVIAAIRGMGA